MSSFSRSFFVWLCLVLTSSVFGEVTCPSIFSDHMVLQRDRPILVWGMAAPGEKVTVEFAGKTAATAATDKGEWKIKLPALPASNEGRSMSISGSNTLKFDDVLVGEVWLCSGQSNMEKPIGPRKGQKPTENAPAVIAQANHPLLRLFQVPQNGKAKPNDESLHWVACTSETVVKTQFSALAYFFGRELLSELNVPVGLIHSSFGGTQIEAWMPAEAFASQKDLAPLVDVHYQAWVKGVQATELYQSMIAPIVPFPLRGFLWYQGEANCMMAESTIYTEKMKALIASWRKAWGDPDAFFDYVLIAPFDYSKRESFPKPLTEEALPVFWEAQANALAVPHTGLVVVTDLVANLNDIHPTNKRDVGLRMARLALADTYGKKGAEAHSPEFEGLHPLSDGQLELRFRHIGEGLKTRDGAAPTEFTIAGEDQKFLPATAEIKGDHVIVSNSQIAKPIAVRFAWHETAVANLVNSSGLPAVPFRSDSWPVTLEHEKKPATEK